jgi:hypothetical protein
MNNTSKFITGTGIVLMLLTAIIHFYDAPDAFSEVAYKGILFVLNGIGALVAAYGIWRGALWGWLFGLLIAGGAIVGYAVSRTVGMPGLPVDPWLEPLGILSLIVEGLFVLLAIYMLGIAYQRK